MIISRFKRGWIVPYMRQCIASLRQISQLKRYNLLVAALLLSLFMNADHLYAEGNSLDVVMSNPHDFQDNELCSACHSEYMPRLSHDPVTTCVRCHEGNIDNHPVSRHSVMVSIPRKMLVPVGLPLSIDDKMICYTCHDYHNETGFGKMLWIEYKNLCMACHLVM